jgi:type IX secretion system PorP/SprF family membrane protein
MKKILFLAIYLAFGVSLKAQQENHYTMFMYNKMMYNPAFAGARDVGSIWGLYRTQWIGFKGAPSSQLLGFDAPLGKTRVSMGGSFSHHRIGVQRDLMANLAYSYGLINTPTTSLKFGINGTYRNFNYDFTNPDLYIRDGITTDDVIVNAGNQNTYSKGNVGAGLFFAHKEFYLGASIPNIYQNKLVTNNASLQQRHFYAFAGGLFPLNEKFALKPAVSARFVKNAAVSFDANLSVMYQRKFTIGASYRTDSEVMPESVSALMYYQANNRLGCGISYDYTLSKLMNFNSGSIEAIVRYDFGISKENVLQNFDNPRYFF